MAALEAAIESQHHTVVAMESWIAGSRAAMTEWRSCGDSFDVEPWRVCLHLRHWHRLLRASGAHRIVQQAGNGHRTDAARHRRDRARDLGAGSIIAIADQLALAVALDAVDAD